jgi:two-component system, chemotaxis family, sensor kinase CheA
MALLPEVNKDLLLDFIDESLDSLSVVESLFVKLESFPDDLKIVDSIFRPVHSVKGNAAYFGLMRVKEISHRLESILDQVRHGHRRIDPRLCNLLLKGLDALRSILAKVRDEQTEIDDEDDWIPLIVELEAETEASTREPSLSTVSREIYTKAETFIASIPIQYRPAAQSLLDLMRPEGGRTVLSSTEADALSRLRIELASKDPKRLDPAREAIVMSCLEALSRAPLDAHQQSIVKDLVDIARTFAGSAVGLDPLAREMLLEKASQLDSAAAPPLATLPVENGGAEPAPLPSEPLAGKAASRKDHSNRTMRITEESMDHFLEQVGELMGLEEQFRYLGKRMVESGLAEEFATDLRQATEQFGHLSSNLSNGVLELRRTEARPLLQKVPRLARDVAEKTGKRIEIVTVGEDVRIDKSYLDLLDAPLMHMVRNACDHGIDTPAERRAAGKPEAGKVEVTILELDESLLMRVADDGRGLNMAGLRSKAIELGVIRPEALFGEAEAVDVLFHSGVSTAAEVTDISGRGVGMDVVKREIEGSGGRIDVKTSAGKGSVFEILLPRSITTRISDGFLFRCGKERFVLPLRNVIETFPVAAATISEVAGVGSTVLFRAEILRLVDSFKLLEAPLDSKDDGVFVRIKVKDVSCVIQVDEALGVQRTVIKPVDEICRGGGIFAGAAMMGDGSLAMVLGEDGLADWLRRG